MEKNSIHKIESDVYATIVKLVTLGVLVISMAKGWVLNRERREKRTVFDCLIHFVCIVYAMSTTLLPSAGDHHERERSIDRAILLLAMPIVLPFYVCLAVTIALTYSGPIFSRQRRLGKSGCSFPLNLFPVSLLNFNHWRFTLNHVSLDQWLRQPQLGIYSTWETVESTIQTVQKPQQLCDRSQHLRATCLSRAKFIRRE